LLARAQDHRLGIGRNGNFTPEAEVARIHQTALGKTRRSLNNSGNGSAPSLRISAGFPSGKHLLAPLWFVLKSRLLRHFYPFGPGSPRAWREPAAGFLLWLTKMKKEAALIFCPSRLLT